jgi:hypothetical protein
LRVSDDELGKYYESLSDEALREINPADLTEGARKWYEREVAKRRPVRAPVPPPVDDDDGEELEPEEPFEVEPDWLEHAECACAYSNAPGLTHASDAAHARDVLLAAGIPCHLSEVDAEPGNDYTRYGEFRVLVPAPLYLKALSVLDQEIFNDEIETNWRTHLATLSAKELQGLDPDDLCAGMVDRAERLMRAYHEEVDRRNGSTG